MQRATPAQVEALVSGYRRLVEGGPEGMGETYQAMAIIPQGAPPPVGFSNVTEGPAEL
jgi:hypothetical protein